MGLEQRLDPLAQLSIPSAGLIEVTCTLFGRQLKRRLKDGSSRSEGVFMVFSGPTLAAYPFCRDLTRQRFTVVFSANQCMSTQESPDATSKGREPLL